MDNKNYWQELLDDMVKKHDLYGRSFTYGVALKKAVEGGWLSEGQEGDLDELIEAYYGEALAIMERYGLRTDTHALVEVIDLSVLDELARQLIGENEEEEDE